MGNLPSRKGSQRLKQEFQQAPALGGPKKKKRLRRFFQKSKEKDRDESLLSLEELGPNGESESILPIVSPARDSHYPSQCQLARGTEVPPPSYSILWEAGDGDEKEDNRHHHQARGTLVYVGLMEEEDSEDQAAWAPGPAPE